MEIKQDLRDSEYALSIRKSKKNLYICINCLNTF